MTNQRSVSSPGTRRLLVLLAALNAIGAAAGAVGLATGVLDLGPRLTGRLPFGSPLLAGAALALLVAVPNGALTTVALRRSRHTGAMGVLVGAAMVAWILVQVAFLRELSFFHPLYLAVGLLMIWAGIRVLRRDAGVVQLRERAEQSRDTPTTAGGRR